MLLLEIFLKSDVLAIEPATWARLMSLMELEARGARLGEAEIAVRVQAAVGGREAVSPRAADGAVAVIPIHGLMFHRVGFLASLFGWKGMAEIAKDVRQAAAASGVKSILLDVSSPGGEVEGTPELAATIAAAARQKPVTAVANATAGSAAYWAASQATELVVTPSGRVGSVGAFSGHTDLSRLLDREGIKQTLIASARFKVEASPWEPLSLDARAEIQHQVDAYGRMFEDAVARGRRTSSDRVRREFGEGRMVLAREAVARGMADRVDTFENTLARVLSAPSGHQSVTSAEADRLRMGVAVAAASRRTAAKHTEDTEVLRLRLRLAEAQ